MSSNETLTAPAPIIDAIDMQAASTPMAEELAYAYQRADGTVERARNAEDAIARCPVLGKLAIEAPDQANILLELAAVGNAKLAAEVREEPKQLTHQEKLSEPKPAKAVEPEKKIPESSPELARTELPIIVREPVEQRQPVTNADSLASHYADTERLEKQRKEFLLVIDDGTEPNTDIIVVSEKLKVEAPKEDNSPSRLPTNKTEPVKPLGTSRNESVDFAPITNLEVEQHGQLDSEIQEIDSEHKPAETTEYTTAPLDVDMVVVEDPAPRVYSDEAILVEPDESPLIPEELVDTLYVGYETTSTETVLEPDDLEVPDFTLSMVNESSVELINHEVEAEPDEDVELLFEPETIETYLELRDLIAEPMVSEIVTVKTVESETESESEPVESPTFEAFVAAQPVTEEVTLESIKVQSSELPLEQTLVKLVEYITDSAEDDEQLEPIIAIIKDIEKSLPKYYFGQDSEEIKIQITPEMADKLLILLRELGYQNPREALVSMVNKLGFAFLLQSLTYLFQLTDEDNCRELLSISAPALSSGDSPLSTLSRLILKIVTGKELLPDNVAA